MFNKVVLEKKKKRKQENKLSQIAYNDIKWNENKAFWSKKIKSLLEQIGQENFGRKHNMRRQES